MPIKIGGNFKNRLFLSLKLPLLAAKTALFNINNRRFLS